MMEWIRSSFYPDLMVSVLTLTAFLLGTHAGKHEGHTIWTFVKAAPVIAWALFMFLEPSGDGSDNKATLIALIVIFAGAGHVSGLVRCKTSPYAVAVENYMHLLKKSDEALLTEWYPAISSQLRLILSMAMDRNFYISASYTQKIWRRDIPAEYRKLLAKQNTLFQKTIASVLGDASVPDTSVGEHSQSDYSAPPSGPRPPVS